MNLFQCENSILDELGDVFGLDNFAIGGGFARDIYFNLAPKDIDIVICRQEDVTSSSLLGRVDPILSRYGYEFKAAHDRYDKVGHSDFEDRLYLVMQFTPVAGCPGRPIDLLFASERYPTPEQYIAANNFSLNQFMIPSGIYHWSTLDMFTPKYVGRPEDFGTLVAHPTSKCSAECLTKNFEKARAVGWTTLSHYVVARPKVVADHG